jgi:flagellar biosynthesis protein FlhA
VAACQHYLMKGEGELQKIKGVIAPAGVIGIILIIIVPLDTHVLDFLLLLSLSISLIILMI